MSNPTENQLNYLRKLGTNNTCRQIILPADLMKTSRFEDCQHVVITMTDPDTLIVETLSGWLHHHPNQEPHK